jgi:NAD(P)H-flavin reductase
MQTSLTQRPGDNQRPKAACDPMLPIAYRIAGVRKENHDTFTIELTAVDGETKFTFAPGQFNMLYIHGVGEVPISISGDPGETDRIVHTTRIVGAVTRAMHKLRRDDVIGLRGPFGTGWPVEAARGRDVVIVTGGIGLAPLRPVLRQIIAGRKQFGRVSLLFGARTPDDLFYLRELETWRKKHNIEVRMTVDRADAQWRGNVGVVTTLISPIEFDPGNVVAMLCGPEVMMRFTIMALRGRGMSEKSIFISMERNMKCAVGFCGHCQYGPEFICKDGPVFPFQRIERLFAIREL